LVAGPRWVPDTKISLITELAIAQNLEPVHTPKHSSLVLVKKALF
jgi:hypothetical protein